MGHETISKIPVPDSSWTRPYPGSPRNRLPSAQASSRGFAEAKNTSLRPPPLRTAFCSTVEMAGMDVEYVSEGRTCPRCEAERRLHKNGRRGGCSSAGSSNLFGVESFRPERSGVEEPARTHSSSGGEFRPNCSCNSYPDGCRV